eukprot:TRINITY_DN21150_c0_g1_i1.p1 TRINITY_DN21150_c0_g1~~TRINITY_DN21150_c0_g1_i1.p1  ORF type:complete len:309 (+),score=50.51 TRINITY_DN21150_c0_g1_i1:54-929(+)
MGAGASVESAKGMSQEELKEALSKFDDAEKQKLIAALGLGPAEVPMKAEKKAKGPSVAIIYYSMYGHILTMAKEIKAGLEANDSGVSVDIFQVPETLPKSVLDAMHAPPKPSDVMTITHDFVDKLPEYDGFIFGLPTRFGCASAQMKTFLDSLGGLWQKGSLAGKPVATFVSTGTQQGGQESTHLTTLPNFVHQGMMYVPLGYQAGGIGQFDMKEVHGGSPWGASTYAGADGSRQPSDIERRLLLRSRERHSQAPSRKSWPPSLRELSRFASYIIQRTVTCDSSQRKSKLL